MFVDVRVIVQLKMLIILVQDYGRRVFKIPPQTKRTISRATKKPELNKQSDHLSSTLFLQPGICNMLINITVNILHYVTSCYIRLH